MLIIDLYTLQTVYTLHLADHIVLYGTYSLDCKNVMWIYRTLGQLITGLQFLTLEHLDS